MCISYRQRTYAHMVLLERIRNVDDVFDDVFTLEEVEMTTRQTHTTPPSPLRPVIFVGETADPAMWCKTGPKVDGARAVDRDRVKKFYRTRNGSEKLKGKPTVQRFKGKGCSGKVNIKHMCHFWHTELDAMGDVVVYHGNIEEALAFAAIRDPTRSAAIVLYDGTVGAEHFRAVGIPDDVWVARCAHLSSDGGLDGLDASMVSAGSSGGGLDESMASASSSVAAADMSLDTSSTSRNSPRKKKLRTTGSSTRAGASTRTRRSKRACTK